MVLNEALFLGWGWRWGCTLLIPPAVLISFVERQVCPKIRPNRHGMLDMAEWMVVFAVFTMIHGEMMKQMDMHTFLDGFGLFNGFDSGGL